MLFRSKNKKYFKSLSDFIHRFNNTYNNISDIKEFPPLRIEILPIEIPPFYKPLSIIILSIHSLDGRNEYEELSTKGFTENPFIGVNNKIGLYTQIQWIIEYVINAVERNNTPKILREQNIDVRKFSDIQKETDLRAKKYAQRIINTLTVDNVEETFVQLLMQSKRAVKFELRKKFFKKEEDRLARFSIYKEIYDRFDFIKKIIDNTISFTFGQGFKFSSPGPESVNDPILNFLDEIALRNQYGKYLNHFLRDVMIYGDGYLCTEYFYKEVFLRVLKPSQVNILKEGYQYRDNGKETIFSKEQVFHINHFRWDDSGYGISELEPLVSLYLGIKHWEQIKNRIESKPRSYILQDELERQAQIDVCKQQVGEAINKMKEILFDPTKEVFKIKKNLYFKS